MEITGLTELGGLMARLAGRFGSIDPSVASQPDLEWRLRAARQLRSLIDAHEAATTAQLEHLIRTGHPDLTEPADASGTPPHAELAGTGGAAGGDAESPASDDLGLPAGSGPWGEGPIRETAEEYLQRLRRAKWLRHLPSFGAALEAGTITIGFVDALATVLDHVEPTVVADVVADQEALLDIARTATRASFVRYLRLRVDAVRADGGKARLERQIADSFAVLGDDDDAGMATLFAKLDPIRGQRVASAIRARFEELRQTGDYSGLRRGQILAQAVCDLICGVASGGSGGVEVLVLADLVTLVGGAHDATIAETSDGLPLPVEVVRDLCGSVGTTVTAAVADERGIVTAIGRNTDDGEAGADRHRRADRLRSADPHGAIRAAVVAALAAATGDELRMGRRIRLANRAQRRALRAMHDTCARPGCNERFDDCFIHHVVTWEDGGPTDLDLLVPLCGRHHHQIHDARWRLTIDAHRTLRWFRPDGTLDVEVVHRSRRARGSPPGEHARAPGSAHVLAGVDQQLLAGDPARLVAEEERHRVRDVA